MPSILSGSFISSVVNMSDSVWGKKPKVKIGLI